MSNLLLFGASGQIGEKISHTFESKNFRVSRVFRNKDNSPGISSDDFIWDPFNDDVKLFESKQQFSAICFAQGANVNDSIIDFDYKNHLELYKANCLYILVALNKLILSNYLAEGCKICVISSIWQDISRPNKLSYSVSKAALQGLINSVQIDLAPRNYLINAILPGAVDTQMTRKSLNAQQINDIESGTLFKKLSDINDIAELTYFLCSSQNTSITGQFIKVDLGYSNAKIL